MTYVVATHFQDAKARCTPRAGFALGHEILDVAIAQLEAMIQADNILNDLGRESVAFVQR